jgi:hypothetical protein
MRSKALLALPTVPTVRQQLAVEAIQARRVQATQQRPAEAGDDVALDQVEVERGRAGLHRPAATAASRLGAQSSVRNWPRVCFVGRT